MTKDEASLNGLKCTGVVIDDAVGSIGTEDGEVCNRDGCQGTIELSPVIDCACHISAPCAWCTDRYFRCTECGARAED